MLGRTVGKYRIIERLGRGGMGTVYKALDETLDREVAIKVLNADLQDTDLMKRFRAEAVTLARLNHPGIATLYELYRDDHDLLMVMEFVRGETLHDLSERVGALAPPQAAHIAVLILDALAHAHRWGVVHRDLKPANLMITDAGAVKVMDFGIARVLGTEHFTQGGYMMGTPAYMAPEQVLGGEVDGRADLYAVGVVLYRLLSGQLPFSADTAIAMVQKQVNDAPTPIVVFQPDLPGWCSDVLARALAKSPGDRFQTAEEFRRVLEASVQTATIGEMPTMATPTPLGLPRAGDLTRTVETPVSGNIPTQLAASSGGAAARPAGAGVALSGEAGSLGTLPADALSHGAGPAGSAGQAAPRAGSGVGPVGDTTAPRPVPPAETTLVLKRKHILALGGVAAVVVVGVVALGFLAFRRAPTFTQDMAIGAPPVEEVAQPGPAAAAPPADAAAADASVPEPPAAAVTPQTSVAAANTAAPPPPKPAPKPPAPPVPPSAASSAAADAGPASATAPPAAAGGGAAPPASSTPVGGLAPVSFDQVRLLVTSGDRTSEVEGVLRLGDGQVSVLPKAGGAPLATLPYAGLTGAAYSRSKSPKWTGPDGKEVEAKVDLGPFGFMRSERNWVIFFSHGAPMIIRLEDGSLRSALPAIEEHAGVKIRR